MGDTTGYSPTYTHLSIEIKQLEVTYQHLTQSIKGREIMGSLYTGFNGDRERGWGR